MHSITAHCLVKNEENFIQYSIKSVIDFVDKIIIFDTGSTDKTAEIIKGLQKEYPEKIIFEEKGECDKKRHTELRQEMLDRTETDWFMILDGDEVWTKRGMEEAVKAIKENAKIESLIAPFYLCIGDVYHYSENGLFSMLGKTGHFSPRLIRKNNARWSGDYGNDSLVNKKNESIFNKNNSLFLQNKFWHLTHMQRSPKDGEDFSSGSSRAEKRRLTYFLIGKKIKENIPEVFGDFKKLSFGQSFLNFLSLIREKGVGYFWALRKQFSKYFIIGSSGVVLDIATLYFFKEYFDMRPVYAVILNQAIMLNYIFFLNKFWSFGAKGTTHSQMIRFYILSGFNYAFSVVWMWMLNEEFHVNYLVARLANIILSVSWNFLIYKFWVFRDQKVPTE